MRAAFRLILVLLALAVPALAIADSAATVAITSPEQGLTITTDSIEIRASYAAPESSAIKQVALVVDGIVYELREVDPPQARGSVSFTWGASRYREGQHRIKVRVSDTAGEMAASEIPVLLKRSPALRKPSVSLTSPAAGSTVSGVVAVQATAERPELVKYVIFLVDDVFKALTNLRPFTYLWDTTSYLNGLHRLQVKAYLSAGGEELSPAVEVRVDNPGGATTMKGPAPAAPPTPAPEPSPYPARAAAPALPPPMRAESPAAESAPVQMAEPEIAAPGTAPFVSPTGDLVIPEPPAVSASPPSQPIEIAALPSAPAEAPIAAAPAPTVLAQPPAPPASAAASAEPPAPALAPAQPTPLTSAPEAAPVALTAPPTPAAAVPALSPAAIPKTAEAAATAPRSAAARAEIAMLPPKAQEVAPAPKLAAAPTPPAAEETLYVVQPGDCLWTIAAAHHISADRLAQFNGITDPYLIHPGQRLSLPPAPIYYDGRPLPGVPPQITQGRALVSFRSVVQEAGGVVAWEAAPRKASALAGGHQIAVTIGSAVAQVDGGVRNMGLAAALHANRTMVPLRFLGETLDLILQYQDGVIHIASAR